MQMIVATTTGAKPGTTLTVKLGVVLLCPDVTGLRIERSGARNATGTGARPILVTTPTPSHFENAA